jgi:hypothetical protein
MRSKNSRLGQLPLNRTTIRRQRMITDATTLPQPEYHGRSGSIARRAQGRLGPS